MDQILACEIVVVKKTVEEMIKESCLTWSHPLVTDENYPFHDLFFGKWKIEVLRPRKKMCFRELVYQVISRGLQKANVFHLLSLINSPIFKGLSGSLLALGSPCQDDFECIGCVVLNLKGGQMSLGIGNWRGVRIGGYDVVGVKKIALE
jgi:hypothetical protein